MRKTAQQSPRTQKKLAPKAHNVSGLAVPSPQALTPIATKIISLPQLMAGAKDHDSKVFGNVREQQALVIARAFFVELNRLLAAWQEGTVTLPILGTFAADQAVSGEDVRPNIERLCFHASRRPVKPKSTYAREILPQSTPASRPLTISFAPEVVYVPSIEGKAAGLYNIDGTPIPAAITHRGDKAHISSSIDKNIDISALPTFENDGGYFYVGPIYYQYGHFLLESMTRLWPFLHWQQKFPGKCLYFGPPAPLASKTFIRQIFATLALDSKDFIAYQAPCKIKNVTIPASAFEIRSRGHHLFREIMLHSGRGLAGDLEKIHNTNLTPLYLSKSKLLKSVSSIVNEAAIEDALRKVGVDILHPETLSLPEQIRELSSRQYLLGIVGSAFHTLLFCLGGKTVAGINLDNGHISSFTEIDRLCGNTSRYLATTDMAIDKVDNSGDNVIDFTRTYYARQPDYVTQMLLAALQD